MEQTFNYNFHTKRSGNLYLLSDKDVIEHSLNSGFTTIGFSEQIPSGPFQLPNEEQKMLLLEIDEYISSMNKLKQEYSNLTILTGFESEYNQKNESFLISMRDKVDYMILNQKNIERDLNKISPINNPDYPIEYASIVMKAMDTGIYDIVESPDLFMKYRYTFEDEESKNEYFENCEIASQMICEKAKVLGIPIEINLLNNTRILNDGEFECSHSLFWKIASEIDGLKVLIGIDAQELEDLNNIDSNYKHLGKIIELIKNKLVSTDYNPITARQNNHKLLEAYEKSKENSLTYETISLNEILNAYYDNPEYSKSISLMDYINYYLSTYKTNSVKEASIKDNNTLEEVVSLSTNENINGTQKLTLLDKKKKTINETNQVLANQETLMQKIYDIISKTLEMGFKSKDEIVNAATQLMQYDTTLNEKQKVDIEKHLVTFNQFKANNQTGGISLKLKNPKYGFTNPYIITLILTFITGFGIGVAYILLNIGR